MIDCGQHSKLKKKILKIVSHNFTPAIVQIHLYAQHTIFGCLLCTITCLSLLNIQCVPLWLTFEKSGNFQQNILLTTIFHISLQEFGSVINIVILLVSCG